MRARWREDGALDDVEVRRLNSTPERVSAVAAWSAQQGAVAAAHEFHAVAGETDGDLPDGVADPGRRVDFVLGEEMLGDDAIDGAGLSRIDRAQHLAGALAPLWRQTRVRRNTPSPDRRPEARQSGQSIGGELVQGNDRRNRLICVRGQADVVALIANVELEQRGAAADVRIGPQVVSGETKAFGRRRAGPEQDRRGIDLRAPEDRLDERGGVRVDREIVTPIAERTPQLPLRSAGRWTVTHNRIA